MQTCTKENSATQLKEKASELVADVKELGSLARSAACERIEGTCEHSREAVQEVEKKLVQYVTQRPLRSLMLACGAGLLVGWLWRHR